MNSKDVIAMNEYENIKKIAIEKGLKYNGVWVYQKSKLVKGFNQ